MYDLLIVGQGLAGTMLAHFALKLGYSVFLIDKHNPNSASNVASGVVNPITGRKMLKTWMADDVIPFSIDTYNQIENDLNIKIIEEIPIKKILSSEQDIIWWNEKLNNIEYKYYLSKITKIDNSYIKNDFGVGTIHHTYWLDAKVLISNYKKYFLEKNILLEENIDYNLIITTDIIKYKNIEAKHLVFAEGYKVQENPYFNFIPFKPAKGEQLKIYAKELEINFILNKNIFIIPIGENYFQVGSTYIWNDETEYVTALGRAEIIRKLEKIISCKYDIVEEKAGIRPTIKDRRPAIGRHQTYKNMYVFNGMGTKGISLSPYFSMHLLKHIFEHQVLLPEVDVSRFY
jgi:glycine oxidase